MTESQKQAIIAALAESLGTSAYFCTRVWNAWNVGTMTDEDFAPVVDDADAMAALADAAIDAVLENAPCPRCDGCGEASILSDGGPDAVELRAGCPTCHTTGLLTSAAQFLQEDLQQEHRRHLNEFLAFRQFHAALCRRFGYSHDPVDFKRDLLSLEEHIAGLVGARQNLVGNDLAGVLQGLLDHVDADQCLHEDRIRGGAIWTLCKGCGFKWADDEGGFVPHADAPAVVAARDALKKHGAATSMIKPESRAIAGPDHGALTAPAAGDALRLALEALEAAQPIMKHYTEPNERHQRAIEAVRAAIAQQSQRKEA